MREEVFFAGGVEWVVGGGEPCQAVLENVDSQRIVTGNANVDTHVEFEAINQQRIVNVLTDHHWLLLFLQDLFRLVREPDAFALRLVARFYDVPLV